MTKNNIIDVLAFLQNSDQLAPLQNAIIKTMREFKQDYNEFHTGICDCFVKELSKEFGQNVSKIRAKTGFTKVQVKKALANKSSQTSNFIEKQKTLLSSAFTEINSYCNDNKTKRMPATDFYRIMQSYTDGHISVRSRLDRLMESGLIDKDSQGVYLVFDKPITKRSNEENLKIIGEAFNYLVSTVIFNKNKPDHLSNLFQRRIRSTQIPPKKSLKIQDEINNILSTSLKQVHDLLSGYEENVPAGTYPEIVIHFLHYNQNLTEEYNHEKT